MFRTLLEKLAAALDRAGMPYMIIGGQAVLLHGEPRLTADVDVTLGIDTDRYEEIEALARTLDFRILPDAPEDFIAETSVLPTMDGSSGIRVDFIFSNTPYERQALGRVKTVTLGNAHVRFASAEDLVIHKIVAGRARDLDDVRGILRTTGGLDTAYIRRWLDEFGHTLDADFLRLFDGLADSDRRGDDS